MNRLGVIVLLLGLAGPAVSAALVNYIETSVNDADGTTIGAVATNQYLEINGTYSTATAPISWSSFRFTHWTNSGWPEIVYRDAWGRAINPTRFVLAAASTATAHYLPATRDADADGLPDWFEMEYFGTLAHAAAQDGDGDGIALSAEYTGSTHPLYGNAVGEGGVATVDSTLVTCNLAGYATYTLRSVPAGTVNQSGVVPPGTLVTTGNLSGTASFGYWTLDGERQADAWGAALTQLTFPIGTADREAVAYLFAGDSDGDGVPDAFEQRYLGTLANGATFDGDGDGFTLLAESTAGTNPLYGNAAGEGGVAWVDSALVTCNIAGYATYTLRSVPAGTVNQTATVLPGTVVTTSNLSGTANFAYWTLDGLRQQDAWGVALTQLTFTMANVDREAVAYIVAGDSDADGVPDAFEQRYLGTLANGATFDGDGDDVTLLAEYTAGTSPVFANATLPGGVAWADSAMLVLDLQADIAVEQPEGTAVADGGACDFGAVLVTQAAELTFTVRNTGGTNLTGLEITLDGADADSFSVSPATLPSLAHNATTTFVVRFAPLTVGARSAALHIASNDPNENPFDVTLHGTGANNPPTIEGPADITIARNASTTGTITIGDVESLSGELQLSATSSDQALAPNAGISIRGSGATRTIEVAPAADATGSATITLTVSDGDLSTSTSFELTVVAYPPQVGVRTAEDITTNSATLRGDVETFGFGTVVHFEYAPLDAEAVTVEATLTAAGSGVFEASASVGNLEPWTTYRYRLVATNSQGESASDERTLRTAGIAPTISTQPQSQTVTVGSEVTFMVVADGVPAPSYTWFKGTTPIDGATEPMLQLTNVQSDDAAVYSVVVTNDVDSVTSVGATLTVERMAQTISFDPLPELKVGDAPFEMVAFASSGLPVSFVSSNPNVATIAGSTLTIVGSGSTTITASQSGDSTFLPAMDVDRELVVRTAQPLTTLLVDEFEGESGAMPDSSVYEWSGDVALSGGQLILSTNSANTTWLRTLGGLDVGPTDVLVVRFRAYAYAEDWYPGIYGDGQPRGLRVGTDPNNAIEFYSAARTLLGMRVRKDGVETGATYSLPVGVSAMNDYEIVVTREEVVFKVNGTVAATITGNTPTGPLNVFFSTYDGGAGNVPMAIDRLTVELNLAGFDLWRVLNFEPAELLDERRSGPNASYASDGLPNLLKYALGLDPKQSHAGDVLSVSLSAGEWVVTFVRPEGISDVTCAVEVSTNLTDWDTAGISLTRVSAAGGVETWEARYPLSGNPKAFFRLRVTRP